MALRPGAGDDGDDVPHPAPADEQEHAGVRADRPLRPAAEDAALRAAGGRSPSVVSRSRSACSSTGRCRTCGRWASSSTSSATTRPRARRRSGRRRSGRGEGAKHRRPRKDASSSDAGRRQPRRRSGQKRRAAARAAQEAGPLPAQARRPARRGSQPRDESSHRRSDRDRPMTQTTDETHRGDDARGADGGDPRRGRERPGRPGPAASSRRATSPPTTSRSCSTSPTSTATWTWTSRATVPPCRSSAPTSTSWSARMARSSRPSRS